MKPTVQIKMWPTTLPNALPHGLNSGHVLIPGDNLEKFRQLRHGLFHIHQPRTYMEARCVETLAANEWRIARCRAELRFFKHHLGNAMAGHPDASGSLCSADLHRLHHRAADCQLEETRLERSTSRTEKALAWMQRERTMNPASRLAAGQRPYEAWLAEGEPVVEEEPAPEGVAGHETAGAENPATPSADSETQTFARRGTARPNSMPRVPNPVGRASRPPAQTRRTGYS